MSELVVGTRKVSTGRPWRAAVIASAILITATIVAWFIYRKSVTYDMPDVQVEGGLANGAKGGELTSLSFGDSTLRYRGGIAVLSVSGEPHQMGAAHGRLLASAMVPYINETKPCIARIAENGGLLGAVSGGLVLDWRLRFVDDGLAEVDRKWLAGMVRGAQLSQTEIDYRELVHASAAIDVSLPATSSAESDVHVLARTLSLTTSLTSDPTRIWLANQLALPGLGEGGDSLAPLVTIAKPTGKIAWVGVGWPGQAGVMVGQNAAGIAIAVHPVRSGEVRATRAARPTAMIARSVLEGAKTIAEAVDIMDNGESLGAAAFVIVDGNDGKAIVVERTPDKTATNRQSSPVISDLLENSAFQTDPQNERARRQLASSMRIGRALRLLKAQPADLGALAGILRDHRGADDTALPLGHRGTIADVAAVNTVILDPRGRSLWVADPGNAGRMRSFDLRSEFGVSSAADMLPDLASDPEAESGQRGQIIAARKYLRNARVALAARNTSVASDWVARALAVAPGLPECLEVAALVAASAGDVTTARNFAQRWFDVGADNPSGEQRARQILAR